MQATSLDSGVPAAFSVQAKPVLKWAGGKRRLAPRIVALLPERIGTYYEPFLGSAAVFFHLAAERRFKRAFLSDANAALMDVYQALRSDVGKLIRVLEGKRYRRLGEDAYYEIRGLDPDALDPYERAARTIYLNKTGYNGLYRLNRAGQFNVPFGRYTRPTIFLPDRLRAASAALQLAELRAANFEDAVRDAKKGDAVYFDPPYVPVSRTSAFTAYSKEAFGELQHRNLADVFGRLAQRGVRAVLSNSDTGFTRDLYEPFDSERIVVARPINSDASKRGGVGELLVRNVPGRAVTSRRERRR